LAQRCGAPLVVHRDSSQPSRMPLAMAKHPRRDEGLGAGAKPEVARSVALGRAFGCTVRSISRTVEFGARWRGLRVDVPYSLYLALRTHSAKARHCAPSLPASVPSPTDLRSMLDPLAALH